MEREPRASEAAPEAAVLFAWVRDSAPGPGPLGLRGAEGMGAGGLRVGCRGLSWAWWLRSRPGSGLGDPGLGPEEERVGRQGSSRVT